MAKTISPQGAINAARQKKIKDFLKAKKHNAAKVDAEKITNDDELRAAMLKLHNVSADEYARAKQK